MNPFLVMTTFNLWFHKSSKLTLDCPSSSVPFGVPHFKDYLNTLLIESVNIDPDALIEESVHNLQ